MSSITPLAFVAGGTGKTGRRVAARLGALGRPVRIGSRSASVPFDWDDPATSPDALAGVPPAEAEGLAAVFAVIFDGRNASVTSGVTDVLGPPARDFRDYAAAVAATGVWEVAA